MVSDRLSLQPWTRFQSFSRRNKQTKKHKTWEGDGVLVSESSGKAVLYDTDGKVYVASHSSSDASYPHHRLGSGSLPSGLDVGTECSFGGKDICVDCATTRVEFNSGRVFGASVGAVATKPAESTYRASSSFKLPSVKPSSDRKSIALEAVDLLSLPSTSREIKENIEIKSQWSANWYDNFLSLAVLS